MVFARRQSPSAKRKAQHKEFIAANWPMIAVNCYQGFLAHGRGSWVTPEEEFVNDAPGISKQMRMTYLTAKELLDANMEHEQKIVATYDPETEVVVTFLRDDGGMSMYKVRGLPGSTPQMLCEMAQKQTGKEGGGS
jgi:hypothetical protein